jgi:hypothetical protein
MKSNVNNQWGTAPDGGLFNGPILGPISLSDLNKIHPGLANATIAEQASQSIEKVQKRDDNDFTEEEYNRLHGYLDDAIMKNRNRPRQSDSYWLDNVAHGVMPLAPSNYTFFRNVKEYGASGNGSTDDTIFINKAVTDGNRCGNDCGSTSVLGALVYFPPGWLAFGEINWEYSTDQALSIR